MFSSIADINKTHNLQIPETDEYALHIFNGANTDTIPLNPNTHYLFGMMHETVTKNMGKMREHYLASGIENAKIRIRFYENMMRAFNNEILCECGMTVKRSNMNKHVTTKKHLKAIEIAGIAEIAETNNEKAMVVAVEANPVNVNVRQQQFINSPLQTSILIGSAGCGKTRTIIEFCIEKHKNKIIKTYNDFMIVTFSRKARTDFIKRGKASSEPKLFNKNNVRTFHSLSHLISKMLFNVATESQNTIVLSTLKNMISTNVTAETLQQTVFQLKSCKFIFIDEAQDINHNQRNLTVQICDTLKIPYCLVGDPNQNIYQFQGGTDKYLFNADATTHFLVDNYRSTVELVEFCNHLRPYDEIFPKMISAKGNHGEKPIIFCGSDEEILTDICKQIRESPYKPEDIAIIGSVKNAKYDDRTHQYLSIGLNLVLNRLNENNIPFNKHYNDGKDNEGEKKEFEVKAGQVNLLTAHGSKGLEFKQVFVINYHFTTQSKRPTEQEYNNFKYLWYVALSRAEENMRIYVDEKKQIFPNIELVPKQAYTTENKPFDIKKIQFAEPMKQTEFHITDIINNNEYFNEDNLYRFKQEFHYTISQQSLYEINNIAIHEHDKYASLYGKYVEMLFTFYYYRKLPDVDGFVAWLKDNLVNSIIFVDKKWTSTISALKRKGIISTDFAMYVDSIDKNKLTTKESEFVMYCQSVIKTNKIVVHIKLDVFEYDEDYIVKLINSIATTESPETVLFNIVLYFYQIENEAKYLLKLDFAPHIASLSIYFDKLDALVKTKEKCDDFMFQKKFKHPNIELVGIVDILQKNKIIELKFVQSVTEKHVIQTLLYYNNVFPRWDVPMDIEIWNLFEGVCHKIEFNTNRGTEKHITPVGRVASLTNWKLNCFLCDTLLVKMENNVFMMDLETNSKFRLNFPVAKHQEIIDRFVYEYGLDYVASTGLIKNAFPLITSHIHGITEKDLQNAEPNTEGFKMDIAKIMLHCLNPIFIAHNGNLFDFKVMKCNNIFGAETVLFLDTKYIFRLFVDAQNCDKLCDIYNKVMGTTYQQTHRAEADTMMIVEICRKLGLTVKDIVDMVSFPNENGDDEGDV
jgi:DNA polymerase III epsilon subunit-like protein